jgi:RNA polymerase sigma-70 factor (ECF subfamily)
VRHFSLREPIEHVAPIDCGSVVGISPHVASTRSPATHETAPILQRVAAGEPGAINECLKRFHGLVWSLARRLGAGPADAEDAVQEIFIDLWKSAERFDPSIASETTFVAMIARRRLIDRGRRRMRRPESAMIEETVSAPPETSDRTELTEAAKVAEAAMAQLRPEQQRVLQLAIHHGCSHEQIAASTGLPLGTVKTHARRGLIRLRQALADSGVAPEGFVPPPPNAATSGKAPGPAAD